MSFRATSPIPPVFAFDSTGQMFVSSRMDGDVYRITPFKEAVAFARNLGDPNRHRFRQSSDTMYVGDRTGTIYKVNGIGEETAWAQLEPSVSAYHLAVGPDEALYVTGPRLAVLTPSSRVGPDGVSRCVLQGIGPAAGTRRLTAPEIFVWLPRFAVDGELCASRRMDKDAEMLVAGMNLVGLAL